METTRHFEDAISERGIRREWCERVVGNPLHVEAQQNGRTRHWGYITEAGKYLRVVVLEDGVTLHTAHFDRNFTTRRDGEER